MHGKFVVVIVLHVEESGDRACRVVRQYTVTISHLTGMSTADNGNKIRGMV